jgi:hypothetical protein
MRKGEKEKLISSGKRKRRRQCSVLYKLDMMEGGGWGGELDNIYRCFRGKTSHYTFSEIA